MTKKQTEEPEMWLLRRMLQETRTINIYTHMNGSNIYTFYYTELHMPVCNEKSGLFKNNLIRSHYQTRQSC